MNDSENAMKVLVVDDDTTMRTILIDTVSRLGYRCVGARDGVEAWDLFRADTYPLVITDWMMPGMDGLDLCRRIRGANRPHYVYIIILTANHDRGDSVTGLESGADDYVIKPYDPSELAARIGVGRRITHLEDERRRDQLKLLQAQKMASVGRLAAGVAHEINNPIGFVASNLRTLGENHGELRNLVGEYRSVVSAVRASDAARGDRSLSEKMKRIADLESNLDVDFLLDDMSEMIEECRSGAARVGEIVHNLTDFSRPAEGYDQDVDLNDCIAATLKVIGGDLAPGVVIRHVPGEIRSVTASPGHINIALLNILTNAIQAIGPTGEIRIETMQIGEWVTVVISDDGPGMASDLVSRIFDPFFTTRQVGSGTGLGLNVAYQIIEQHGGMVDVQSEPGEGTTFTLRIPARRESHVAEGALSREANHDGK